MIIINRHLLKWKVLISVKAGAEQDHSLEIIYKNQLLGRAWQQLAELLSNQVISFQKWKIEKALWLL